MWVSQLGHRKWVARAPFLFSSRGFSVEQRACGICLRQCEPVSECMCEGRHSLCNLTSGVTSEHSPGVISEKHVTRASPRSGGGGYPTSYYQEVTPWGPVSARTHHTWCWVSTLMVTNERWEVKEIFKFPRWLSPNVKGHIQTLVFQGLIRCLRPHV